MKQVIVNEHIAETDVHPPGLYQCLVDICVASAEKLLAQPEQFVEIDCPACASPDRESAFEKHSYRYWSCHNCATLFVSPRPSEVLLDQYLLDSPVAAFRDSNEYRRAISRRAKALGQYRAEWVSELGQRIRTDRHRPLIDVETRSPDYLLAFSQRQDSPIITVKPLGSLSSSLSTLTKSLTIVDNIAEVAGVNAKLMTAFDVLEHQVNPFDWMQQAHAALDPGGLLIITTRSGSGFDIQTLWEHASIFPVEHINLISVEGIQALLARTGFEVVEVSTPGQLDVQMIERIWIEQQEGDAPRFLRYFLSHRDRYAKRRLQQFLQANLLSSHLRVVARRAIAT